MVKLLNRPADRSSCPDRGFWSISSSTRRSLVDAAQIRNEEATAHRTRCHPTSLVLSPDWPFQRPALENLARPPKNHFA